MTTAERSVCVDGVYYHTAYLPPEHSTTHLDHREAEGAPEAPFARTQEQQFQQLHAPMRWGGGRLIVDDWMQQ